MSRALGTLVELVRMTTSIYASRNRKTVSSSLMTTISRESTLTAWNTAASAIAAKISTKSAISFACC
jgi:hypothetical protein